MDLEPQEVLAGLHQGVDGPVGLPADLTETDAGTGDNAGTVECRSLF